jgi:AraC family transcriptional regulator
MPKASERGAISIIGAQPGDPSAPCGAGGDMRSCLLDFMPGGMATHRSVAVASDTPDARSSAPEGYIAYCARGSLPGRARPSCRADAVTICVDLHGAVAHSASSDDTAFVAPSRHPGEVTLYDRRYRWHFDLPDDFEGMLFHLPRASFENMVGAVSFDWSSAVPGLFCGGQADETLRCLATAAKLLFESGEGMSPAFATHLTASVTLHLTRRYGVAKPAAEARGGLGPWREARVRDLVGRHLHEPLKLASLAKACGLSTSHFAREFKTSFGCSPHHWLRLQRLERAKSLISTTAETLSDIAAATGFADQSHMTRIFSRHENISPAAWRRNSAHRGAALNTGAVRRSAHHSAIRQAPQGMHG